MPSLETTGADGGVLSGKLDIKLWMMGADDLHFSAMASLTGILAQLVFNMRKNVGA